MRARRWTSLTRRRHRRLRRGRVRGASLARLPRAPGSRLSTLFQRGLAPVIITTGGAGNDPHYSEGQVGRDYLAARGIPDAHLIAETQGGDTEQSAERVAVILHANDMDSALLVSDAYHMFRAKQMMSAQGITVYISPRPDSVPKTAFGRYLGALREAFSYMLYKLKVR